MQFDQPQPVLARLFLLALHPVNDTAFKQSFGFIRVQLQGLIGIFQRKVVNFKLPVCAGPVDQDHGVVRFCFMGCVEVVDGLPQVAARFQRHCTVGQNIGVSGRKFQRRRLCRIGLIGIVGFHPCDPCMGQHFSRDQLWRIVGQVLCQVFENFGCILGLSHLEKGDAHAMFGGWTTAHVKPARRVTEGRFRIVAGRSQTRFIGLFLKEITGRHRLPAERNGQGEHQDE